MYIYIDRETYMYIIMITMIQMSLYSIPSRADRAHTRAETNARRPSSESGHFGPPSLSVKPQGGPLVLTLLVLRACALLK